MEVEGGRVRDWRSVDNGRVGFCWSVDDGRVGFCWSVDDGRAGFCWSVEDGRIFPLRRAEEEDLFRVCPRIGAAVLVLVEPLRRWRVGGGTVLVFVLVEALRRWRD